MLGGINPIPGILSRIYGNNTIALSKILARIASGKKVANAADDMVGFLRAASLQTDVEGYETVQVNLVEAKGMADYAVEVGSNIAEDLARMKELAQLYAVEVAGGNDPDVLAAYSSEFNALKVTVKNLITESYYDGIRVVDDSSARTTVELTPDKSGGTFTIDFTDAVTTADIDLLDIAAVGAEDDVQAQIEINANYLFEAEGFSDSAQRYYALSDIIISNKKSVSSLITDIDYAKELSRMTDMQIRQQAAVAMMSQANIVRSAIVRLFYKSE